MKAGSIGAGEALDGVELPVRDSASRNVFLCICHHPDFDATGFRDCNEILDRSRFDRLVLYLEQGSTDAGEQEKKDFAAMLARNIAATDSEAWEKFHDRIKDTGIAGILRALHEQYLRRPFELAVECVDASEESEAAGPLREWKAVWKSWHEDLARPFADLVSEGDATARERFLDNLRRCCELDSRQMQARDQLVASQLSGHGFPSEDPAALAIVVVGGAHRPHDYFAPGTFTRVTRTAPLPDNETHEIAQNARLIMESYDNDMLSVVLDRRRNGCRDLDLAAVDLFLSSATSFLLEWYTQSMESDGGPLSCMRKYSLRESLCTAIVLESPEAERRMLFARCFERHELLRDGETLRTNSYYVIQSWLEGRFGQVNQASDLKDFLTRLLGHYAETMRLRQAAEL